METDFLEGLNEAQKKAVCATEGPVLIVAGAGAGKTKTIVHRMCYLVSKGISPSQILAVTFTNKAAKEMRERALLALSKMPTLMVEGETPFVSTFHRLAVFLLRLFGAHEGSMKRFSILDDDDTTSLIKEALREMGLDPKHTDSRAIKSLISRSTNAGQDEGDLSGSANPNHRLTARVWEKYRTLKRAAKALDFDDLLTETAALLEKNSEARAWCEKTWKYIHVDEYQDTNEVQYRIARTLAGSEKNICVVGDSDQSIYSWRGANIKNILEFERDYPEAQTIVLEENYRSTKTVLSAANEIITKNEYRQPKKLFTTNADGHKITTYAAYDEADEAAYIVERAVEAMDSGVPASDIAVLFRTNFQSRALEEAFLRAHIPYHVLGVRFFERREVKDVFSYIRAALNPDSLLDIKRTINTPARGIGKVTIATLFSGGIDALSGKAKAAVQNYYAILERMRTFLASHSTSETIKYTIAESGIEDEEKASPDGEDRLENLRELVTLGTRYDHLDSAEGLEALLEEAALVSDQDNVDGKEGVKLMTIHAAKGLEFHTVFISGLEQGLFPHERDVKLPGADGEEERRLMYVALTRARKKLYLTYASMRTIFGMRDVRLPSEFLIDLPDELLERDSREGESGFTIYL